MEIGFGFDFQFGIQVEQFKINIACIDWFLLKKLLSGFEYFGIIPIWYPGPMEISFEFDFQFGIQVEQFKISIACIDWFLLKKNIWFCIFWNYLDLVSWSYGNWFWIWFPVWDSSQAV